MRNQASTKYIMYLLGVFLASSMLMGCQRQEEQRTKADELELLSIEDSVENQSVHARKMIERGLSQAPDSITYYEYLARLGKYFSLSATPDSTSLYINKVISYAQPLPESPRRNSLLAYAYNCQAANYHNFHMNEDKVVTLYHRAYQLLLNSDSQGSMPEVCANLGDAYVFKNQLPSAANWYRRALFLVDSLNLPKQKDITLYMGLGRIYLLLDDFDSSLKCYQQTVRHFKDMTLNMQAYFLNNYGNYYYYAKNYPVALQKFLQLKQLLIDNKLEETFSMYLCKLNLADVYLNLGKMADSEKCLDEVEPYMRKNGDAVAIYYCHTIRIGQAVKKGDMAAVSQILASEHQTGDVEFSLRKIRNLYLREYYEVRGDYQKAYQNMKNDVLLDDSLEHNRVSMRAAEIMGRFAQDTLRLHHRIAIEHKNAEIQESRSLIFAILGIIIILALGIALYVIHTRRKYEQAKLNVMQLKLNNVRNRISPHFVFNVLNNKIIKSEKQEADELLELTKLIRTNLDMSCRLEVTLREELDFVRKYVDVERHLVGEDFDFQVIIDDAVDLEQTLIPSMFVQILTENALVHGLKGWEGSKRLTIQVKKEEDGSVRVRITDNGSGFDARAVANKQRTGLNIIRQTISMYNECHRQQMRFQMHNRKDPDGKVLGCEADLLIIQKK